MSAAATAVFAFGTSALQDADEVEGDVSERGRALECVMALVRSRPAHTAVGFATVAALGASSDGSTDVTVAGFHAPTQRFLSAPAAVSLSSANSTPHLTPPLVACAGDVVFALVSATASSGPILHRIARNHSHEVVHALSSPVRQMCASTPSLVMLATDDAVLAWGDFDSWASVPDSSVGASVGLSLRMVFPHPVRQVACGPSHCLLLAASGHVLSLGHGGHGQLGHGATDSELSPRVVEMLAGLPLTAVACGAWHSLVLAESGDVYSFGSNKYGQLGRATAEEGSTERPQDGEGCHKNDEDADDDGVDDAVSCTEPGLVSFPGEADITVAAVGCGSAHSVALDAAGRVFSWGRGDQGQHGQQSGNDELFPRLLPELKDHIVHRIVCGSDSWMWFACSTSTR